jgi:tRNA dimethylallyltransferase
MNASHTLAILGPTASGKTALALDISQEYGGIILSLDSLAVYRDIDIASAKPTPSERGSIPHYGIDLLAPDEAFDVVRFGECYRNASSHAKKHDVPLIIVGGTGFYLKALLEGMSPLPTITEEIQHAVAEQLVDVGLAHQKLAEIDRAYANRIKPTDRYRIEKGLLIAYATHTTPTEYFRRHPPIPIIQDPLPIYEVSVARDILRERIALRTVKMLREGLIDEVCMLERRYTRAPNPMKSIGIREVLDHLDGRLSTRQLREAIITHTAQLAKRQVTFNKSQLGVTFRGSVGEIRKKLEIRN